MSIIYKCDLCHVEQGEQKRTKDNPLKTRLVGVTSYSILREIDPSIEHTCMDCDEMIRDIYKHENLLMGKRVLKRIKETVEKIVTAEGATRL